MECFLKNQRFVAYFGFGVYQNLQRVRILVDDISLYESSWNRALRLDSYLSSSRQQQAAKRGEMSQILHVMLCNYHRLKKIVIVINDTSSKVLGRA